MMRWVLSKIILLTAMLFLLTAHAEEAEIVRHGDRSIPRIAITVDDCYDRKHIEAVVELCEMHGVPVTFFPIGNALKFADGPLWQRALDAGCEIGNHTWGHKILTVLTAREIRFQMLRIQQKVDEMLGYHYPMQVMRPSGGYVNGKVQRAVASVGYHWIVKWDVSQTDPQKALQAVQNGSILLFHARAGDVRCLEVLIPALLETEYECVTVSELLGLPPVAISEEIYIYESSHADNP